MSWDPNSSSSFASEEKKNNDEPFSSLSSSTSEEKKTKRRWRVGRLIVVSCNLRKTNIKVFFSWVAEDNDKLEGSLSSYGLLCALKKIKS